MQEQLRVISTRDKVVEAASKENVVGDAQAVMVEDADAVHSQIKCQEEMEVFTHL